MAKPRKLPSGNWNIRVGDGKGGKTKSFTAATKKEVILLAAEYVNGKICPVEKKTVGECIDEYINAKENILSPTTINGYKKIRKNTLNEICYYLIGDITGEQIQRHFNELSARLSPKYLKNSLGLLASVFRIYRPDYRLNITLPKKQKVYG